MRKVALALLVVLTCVSFTVQPGLRYDGVYASREDGYVSYLRFYPEGNVISASSTGTPDDIKKWMCLDTFMLYEWHSRGGFRIKEDSSIRFATTSSAGTVEYEGIIENDTTLRLSTHSLINENRSEETYHFIPIEEWKK